MSACAKYSTVDPKTYNIWNMQIPKRYGECTTCVNPAHTLPPMTSRSRAPFGRTSCAVDSSLNTVMVSTASSMSTADTSSMFTAPTNGASEAVAADPMIDPAVPPTPMNPNTRFACSLRHESAISVQKIDVLNNAYTVIQT